MIQSIRTLQHLTLIAAACAVVPQVQAAAATADAKFLGIADVRLSGSATFSLTPHSTLEAVGMTTGGVDDPFNDMMTFDSEVSPFGEATATNSGPFSATSFAAVSDFNEGMAFTFSDTSILVGGVGTIELDLEYSLFVDAFGNLPTAFAVAGIEASSTFATLASDELSLTGLDVTGFGTDLFATGLLTLIIEVDDGGFGVPFEDVLFIHTYASVASAPVPVPAAVWLLGSAVAGVAGYRRRAAAV